MKYFFMIRSSAVGGRGFGGHWHEKKIATIWKYSKMMSLLLMRDLVLSKASASSISHAIARTFITSSICLGSAKCLHCWDHEM